MVFLIGLATSLVALNVGRDADDIAKLEADRFAALVQHLQDEATLAGLPMGIEVSVVENRYRFWELLDQWQRVEDVDVLRERRVPDRVEISVDLLRGSGTNVGSDAEQMQAAKESNTGPAAPLRDMILIEPTGLAAHFVVRFAGDSRTYTVSLDNGFVPVISDDEN